jgi:hypothetical protein
MKCEPQASIAQPSDVRINARVFELGIEVGKDRHGSSPLLKTVDAALDDIVAQMYPLLDHVDELPLDQVRRLLNVL